MRSITALVAAALLAGGFASTVQAQPAAPAGPRAAASAPGGPGGSGPMMGGRWGSRYTPGWSMMTPQERDEHHRRMADVRTYDDCRKAVDEHRALMASRASERGVQLRTPRRDACAGLPKG